MNTFLPKPSQKGWHGSCEYIHQLCDCIVSYLQSFLSLIRLHESAAFFFPGKGDRRWASLCMILALCAGNPGVLGAEDERPAPVEKRDRVSVPILCYHQVVPKATGLFELSEESFKTQLTLLKASGYQSVNSIQLLDFLAGHTKPVGKPIVISFDDGYKSVFDYAFPIMKEAGFVGVACVYPEFIGSGGGMSWAQLKQMAEAGWTIECHSYSHANLEAKTPSDENEKRAFFEREIARPKRMIEEKTGLPVRLMAWPYGIYTEETEAFARSCGYVGAMTVDGGSNYPGIDSFRLKRQVVYRNDTLDKFTIRFEMGALEVSDPSPRPGEIVHSLKQVSCVLPGMKGENPDQFVLNAKVTGGTLAFRFDPATQKVIAELQGGSLKAGQHFIDVYLRDKRTGVTQQNGWLFTIKK